MPIVDISGLSAKEAEAKGRIRKRIQQFYHKRLGMPLTATTVTFITDETAGDGKDVHLMARLYSKMFMTMEEQKDLDQICDTIVIIMEEEAGHVFNEAFPVPVMAMRGGHKPYKGKDQ